MTSGSTEGAEDTQMAILSSSTHATYIDGSKSWCYSLGLALILIDLVTLPIICVLIWRRRNVFPLNSTPAFLVITTQVGASVYVISLLQSIVFPAMPCWLHFIISWADYFPFFCGTMLQLFRNWYVFNLQQSLSSQKRNWYTKYPSLVTDTNLKRVLVGMAAILFILPVIQLATRSTTTLSRTFVSPDCLAYSSQGEKAVLSAFWYTLIIANVTCAVAMRNIDDAFNLKENWKSILYFFVMGAPLNAMATNSDGIVEEIRLNSYVLGQFAYVAASFSYMWFASVSPIRQSYIREDQDNKEKDRVTGANKKDRDEKESRQESPSLSVVLTTQDLKAALKREELLNQFKQYLIREFCCENILFLQAQAKIKCEPNVERKRALLRELVDDYLREGSPFEVNISQELRLEVISRFTDTTTPLDSSQGEDDGCSRLLESVEEEIYRILLSPYNRFIRNYNLGHAFRRNSSARVTPANITSRSTTSEE